MKKTYIFIFIFIIGIAIANFSQASEIINEEKLEDGTTNITYEEEFNLQRIKDELVTKRNSFQLYDVVQPEEPEETRYYCTSEILNNSVSSAIYKAMSSDTEASGKAVAKFTNLTIDMPNQSTSSYLNEYHEEIEPHVYDAIIAVINDYPELYWFTYSILIKHSVSFNDERTEAQITQISVETKMEENAEYKAFNDKVDEVVEQCKANSIYETAKNIHDYICMRVETEGDEEDGIDNSSYGALMNQRATSEGLGRLFDLLCKKSGLNTISVMGTIKKDNNDENHLWNYLYHPDDKLWYAVDVSADTRYNTTTGNYEYFMIGNNTLVDNDKKFSTIYEPGIKHYEKQTYIPKTPVLSNEAYEQFTAKIDYSETEETKNNVTVTIETNRELNPVEGWNLSSDKTTLSKEYSENTKEEITIENTRGEVITQTIEINNINKDEENPGGDEENPGHDENKDIEAPEVTIEYTPNTKTNTNVKVILKANEKVQNIDDWELSSDETELSKIYTENAKEVIEVKDIAGNSVQVNVNVDNIDKQAPEVEINYKKDVDVVTVEIIANEEIKEVEGWNLSEDKKALTKEYTENAVEQVTIEDEAGNIVQKSIKVEQFETNDDNINNDDNTNNTNNNLNQNTGKELDKTTSNLVLPKTGISKVILGIILVISVIGIIVYIKYKRLKGITK